MAAPNGLAMSWDEWGKQDAVALADLIRRKQVTARQVAAQTTAAVEAMDPKLGAVLEVFADVVENPDKEGSSREGALYGVPFFLKDMGSGLKGRRQEQGSRLLKGNVAKATDPILENFLRAGMVPIGRSTAPEFGMTIDTVTDYLDRLLVTRNPWNLDRTPGGSSGGSAALVAAGVAPVSMGSDGGGSIRIPASFTGLVGLKPSRGRVPRPLGQSEFVARHSGEGVLTRSVRDTAAAFDYLTRIPIGGTFIAMGPPQGSYLDAIKREPGRLRIGLSTGAWGRPTRTDPEVAERVRQVAKTLEGLGHMVEEFDDTPVCDWDALWWSYNVYFIGSRAEYRTIAIDRGIDPAALREHLNSMNYRFFLAADRYDKYDFWKMASRNNLVTRAFGRLMERYDVRLTPTSAIRVPKANGPYGLLRDEELDPWLDPLVDSCRYTMPGNEIGAPGISLPAGLDRDGLPIGVQFQGNFGREDVLLQLAAQFERAKPEWFGLRPPHYVSQIA